MSFSGALVAIVAIIAFTAMRIVRYRAGLGDLRDRHSRHGPASPSPREEQLTREIEDLRDRLAVLERIATEDRHGKAIAAEIESLRDR
jgi:hypothetical protein